MTQKENCSWLVEMSKLVVVLTISDCILQVIALSGQRQHICSESTDQVGVMECNFPEVFKPNKVAQEHFSAPLNKSLWISSQNRERPCDV